MPEEDSLSKQPVKSFRKGALVRVKRVALEKSLESSSSDTDLPDYIFKGPGELLAVKGDYGQVRWRRPVPDVWLRLDQLEEWKE
tara:strand:- start:3187 stop:3438 length:252 start_codon:yes stop_codon:yes gene_type:complete